MALSGHRVICWDENGRPAVPEIVTDEYKIEVYKEFVSLSMKEGDEYKPVASVFDGYTRFHGATIIVRGSYKKILFCIEADEKLRFGIAKHEDYREITMDDIRELALFLAYLASGLYSPGYSSWTWLFGYTPDSKLIKAVKNIDRIVKIDQGDVVLGGALTGEIPGYKWFNVGLPILTHLLGVAEDELDDYEKEIEEAINTLRSSKYIKKEQKEKIENLLIDYLWNLVFNKR